MYLFNFLKRNYKMRIKVSEIFNSLVVYRKYLFTIYLTYRSFDRKMTHLHLNNFSREYFFNSELKQRFNFWLKFLDDYTI